MSSKLETKTKILDVAEQLFASHGFAETSLRGITAKAEVNLASVNYHFGSKKSLIQAVFDRFMEKFTEELLKELIALEQGKNKLDAKAVISTLIRPIIEIDKVRPNGASVFMKLCGRAYTETQGHIRRFAMERYSHVLVRFTRLLHKTSPSLSGSDMFWRLHFMLGSFIFTLAGLEALQEISESDFSESVSTENIIDRLIPFLSAGFESQSTPIDYLLVGENS